MDSKKRFFIIHFREKNSKQNMKKTFRENVFVCEDFSLNHKENKLQRKYIFWGVYLKYSCSSNFRDRTKLMLPLDLARLRAYKNIFFVYLSSKIKCIYISYILHTFFSKKSNFMNLLKKIYH